VSAAAKARQAIDAGYRARTQRSAALHEQARTVIPGGVTRSVTFYEPYPVWAASGCGCRLTDVDGNQYLDCLNNFGSMIHGHAHPGVVAAIREQVADGIDFGAPTALQLEFARAMSARIPSVERIRFTSSGTEAVLYAVRAARAFTAKPKLLKMEGSYHGGYDSVTVSVDPGANAPAWPQGKRGSRGLSPAAESETLVAPFNDLERTASIIRAHRNELAAVIVEAVTVRGMITADAAFLQGLRNVTRESGVLLILDEVVTFRLAPGGAQELFGVTPDLTTFGKLIGGGLPIGAFGGRADIMDGFDLSRAEPLHHSGTFAGSSAALAAGLATLKLFTRAEGVRINALGDRLRDGIRARLDSLGVRAQLTGLGSLAGLHFSDRPVRDYRSGLKSNREAMRWLHLALLNRGIFARSTGSFFLSTAMTEAEVDEAAETFGKALADVRAVVEEQPPGGRPGLTL
jgi:glutamate-1-semialdehyde 2,1-aminomutase